MTKLDLILKSLNDLNLLDILVYDMRGRSPFFDYVVLTTATNKRQLQASVKRVKDALAEASLAMPKTEGDDEAAWLLIDAEEVIVNVFLNDERTFYHFEKLWPDVPHWEYDGA